MLSSGKGQVHRFLQEPDGGVEYPRIVEIAPEIPRLSGGNSWERSQRKGDRQDLRCGCGGYAEGEISMKDDFSVLFQPQTIGRGMRKLTLKNRMVMAPMVTCFADSRGEVTQRLNENFYLPEPY